MPRFSLIVLFFAWMLACRPVVADVQQQFDQAINLSSQGQWQQAADLFQQLAQLKPDWPEPKNNLAVALLKLGKVEQARQTLEQAVTAQPSFKVAQSNRQKLYDHLAAQAYEKALGNKPQLKLPNLQLLEHIQSPGGSSQPDLSVESQADYEQQIHRQLDAWSRAWSASDVDGYLACYSAQYQHFEQDISYQQWRNQRRQRVKSARDVEVSVDNIKIFIDTEGKKALVEFIQSYRSRNYSDKVIKQLLLSNDDEQWLITSERVLKLL